MPHRATMLPLITVNTREGGTHSRNRAIVKEAKGALQKNMYMSIYIHKSY